MKKILMIIFMYIIASNSFYGVVNEKEGNTQQLENITQNEVVQEVEEIQEVKEETKSIENTVKTEEIEQKETNKITVQNDNNFSNTKQENEQQEKKETVSKTNKNNNTVEKAENNTKHETNEKKDISTITDNNHKCVHGDEGWYNTKSEAQAVYDNKISSLDMQWANGDMSTEEYRAKKPNGYEIWDCAECHKWTISMY